MFDVSFTEMLVIGVVALIVIGPERLPKVARTIGHLLGRAQRYVSDVKTDIRREIELDELRKFKDQMQDAAGSVQSSLRDTSASLRAPLDDLSRSFSEAGDALKKDLDGASGTGTSPADTTASPQSLEDVPPLSTPPGTPEDTDTPPRAVAGGASELPEPEPVRAPATAQAQAIAPAPVTPLPPNPEPARPADSTEPATAPRATPQTPNGSPS